MKKKLLEILPSTLVERYKKIRLGRILSELYSFDKRRYRESAYNLRNPYTEENLRAKITFHYHSIEKGLSNERFRHGFGKRAFRELFVAMDTYVKMGFDTTDSRFQQGLSTIQAYVKLHDEHNQKVECVEEKLKEYLKFEIKSAVNQGGAIEVKSSDLPDYGEVNFKELAINRHSIRDFGKNKISEEDIFEAIEIAIKSPSACNRQASKVYYIKEQDKIDEIFTMQGGLTTHGVNLQGFLLVTCDRQYMNGPHERNQTYIDGGIFLMSLIYGLTYKNIASCALNTNFYLDRELQTRKMLNISESEDLIAFIAIGSFPDNVKYAVSPRDTAEVITRII